MSEKNVKNDEPVEAEAAAARGGLRPDAYLQALEKGMAVFEVFTATKPYLTIAEASQLSGQDRATTRRALLTLAHLGYIHQNGKYFSLTAKVLTFSYQYLASLPFWAQAHPVLEELSDELNETISIGVMDGLDVVFILRVPAKRLLTFDPSTGSRVPAHVHSLGHILWAQQPEAHLQALVSQVVFKRFTPQSLDNAEALLEGIHNAKKQGWALISSQHEENLGGISVPLQDKSGQTIAALNVNFIMDSDSYRRAREDILPRLQLAARRIQQALPDSWRIGFRA